MLGPERVEIWQTKDFSWRGAPFFGEKINRLWSPHPEEKTFNQMNAIKNGLLNASDSCSLKEQYMYFLNVYIVTLNRHGHGFCQKLFFHI